MNMKLIQLLDFLDASWKSTNVLHTPKQLPIENMWLMTTCRQSAIVLIKDDHNSCTHMHTHIHRWKLVVLGWALEHNSCSLLLISPSVSNNNNNSVLQYYDRLLH